MVKVIIERMVKRNNFAKLVDYLNDMRAAALHQPGYVSGETLTRGKDPIEVVIISTWVSEDHWNAWTTSPKRIEMENDIEPLLMHGTDIKVYRSIAEEG